MMIRSATRSDRDAILALVRRISETGTPAARDPAQSRAADLNYTPEWVKFVKPLD